MSKNFKQSEFNCKCGKCESLPIARELYPILELLRCHFNEPVFINSGYRCSDHNKYVGGAENSQHLLAKAVDIKVNHVSAKDTYLFLCDVFPNDYGFGCYSTWVHIDVRDGKERKARWGY